MAKARAGLRGVHCRSQPGERGVPLLARPGLLVGQGVRRLRSQEGARRARAGTVAARRVGRERRSCAPNDKQRRRARPRSTRRSRSTAKQPRPPTSSSASSTSSTARPTPRPSTSSPRSTLDPLRRRPATARSTSSRRSSPTHPRVAEGMIEGKRGGDVFSSDRYKAVVGADRAAQLGGVETDAPEQADPRGHRPPADRRQRGQAAVPGRSCVATHAVNAFALADGHVYVTRGLLDTDEEEAAAAPDRRQQRRARPHPRPRAAARDPPAHRQLGGVPGRRSRTRRRPLDPSVAHPRHAAAARWTPIARAW